MGIERRTRTTAIWVAAAITCGGAVAAANSTAADRGPEDSKPPAGDAVARSTADDAAAERVSAAASAKVRATRRLSNKMFTRFTQSGDSSYDQRLHLCRDKSFIYDTQASGSDPQRTEGRWRVTSARIRGRNWSARVRGAPEGGGSPVTVVIRVKRGRVTVNGGLVFVNRSDLC
jgi:hypothetical protein